MKFIKGLFTFVGAVVVIGLIFAFVKFDLGSGTAVSCAWVCLGQINRRVQEMENLSI